MVFVQKSSMAGLNCYPGRLAYGCCLGMQILRRFPPLKDKSGSLCLNCLNKQCGLYATPAFHLASGIWVCARQRLPTWSVPSPNIEHWVASELPWWATLHVFSHVGLVVGGGGGWSRSFVTPLRGDPWKLAPGFPRLCPGASSLCWLCQVSFPYNQSHEYKGCWVLWVRLLHHQTWGGLEGLPTQC